MTHPGVGRRPAASQQPTRPAGRQIDVDANLETVLTQLAGTTASVDQKIGRDATERYAVLRKELDQVRAELDRVLGSSQR